MLDSHALSRQRADDRHRENNGIRFSIYDVRSPCFVHQFRFLSATEPRAVDNHRTKVERRGTIVKIDFMGLQIENKE